MRRLVAATVILAFVGLVSGADEKANPTGTWKWKVTRGNNTVEQTLKLKIEGDKLTGALVGRNNNETKIEDGTFKDGEVTFKVTRERNGQKTTTKYSGKLEKDTIKGKITPETGDPRDWEAKRSAD